MKKKIQRANALISGESIGQIAQAVQAAAGLSERATQPANPGDSAAPGAFDFDTAQFHDVSRSAQPGGRWAYRAVMVDAQGRTTEVELEPEQGKTAFETMQMVKESPFAEAIYRSMVMPMLDKMAPRRGGG